MLPWSLGPLNEDRQGLLVRDSPLKMVPPHHHPCSEEWGREPFASPSEFWESKFSRERSSLSGWSMVAGFFSGTIAQVRGLCGWVLPALSCLLSPQPQGIPWARSQTPLRLAFFSFSSLQTAVPVLFVPLDSYLSGTTAGAAPPAPVHTAALEYFDGGGGKLWPSLYGHLESLIRAK